MNAQPPPGPGQNRTGLNRPDIPDELVIASRSSPLALRQSQLVAARIQALLSVPCRILPVTTAADRMVDRPLKNFGGKGVFVKELETALYQHRADLAVHSLKDVPSALPPGLALAAILERDHPGDVLVLREGLAGLESEPGALPVLDELDVLPGTWRLGSGSLRRQCQLFAHRPHWHIVPVRGNIGTRLQRLRGGDLDGIVLARAGLERMDGAVADTDSLSALAQQQRVIALSYEQMLPCPGQGALCVECLSARASLRRQLTALHHEPSARCVRAERALSRLFGADCHAPLAAYAFEADDRMCLAGLVAKADRSLVRAQEWAKIDGDNCDVLAGRVYERMRSAGAPATVGAPARA